MPPFGEVVAVPRALEDSGLDALSVARNTLGRR
jgi:hypothetical protein